MVPSFMRFAVQILEDGDDPVVLAPGCFAEMETKAAW
jgi:hypothetical protein